MVEPWGLERDARGLDEALSFAGGLGAFAPPPELERPAFVLSETTRGAALGAAAVMRLAASSPRYRELRGELAAQSETLASLVRQGRDAQHVL